MDSSHASLKTNKKNNTSKGSFAIYSPNLINSSFPVEGSHSSTNFELQAITM